MNSSILNGCFLQHAMYLYLITSLITNVIAIDLTGAEMVHWDANKGEGVAKFWVVIEERNQVGVKRR